MLNWTIEKLNLYLKHNWSISRGTSTQKTNFYIKVSANGCEGLGEVAPNIRYYETPEKILSEFAMLLNNDLPLVKNIDKLLTLMATFKISQSLRNGIENAYIDWHCKKEKISVFQFLKTKKEISIPTSFTIPIMQPAQVEGFHLRYDLNKFKYLKVKIDAENGLELLKAVDKVVEQPIIIDANEAFSDVDQFISFSEKIASFNILFIEQPLPADKVEEYIFLKDRVKYEIWADESITSNPDFSLIKKQFHGINMKLMKAGGLLSGHKILKDARLYGLKTMIGCMVETTVAISNGFYLASEADYYDLDSFLYLELEPSNRVIEKGGDLFLYNY